MREIKFRAWDKKVGQMINHFENISFDFQGRLESIKSIYDLEVKEGQNSGVYERKAYEIDLLEFTGLLDKNAKEVYEGDILGEYKKTGDFAEQYEPYGKVYFDTDLSAFCVEQTNGGWEYLHVFLDENLTKYSEVIGNIYENPDLLQ